MNLEDLKVQRASTKGCITRIKNIVETKSDSLTHTELECRLGILESYFKQLLSYQMSIEKLTPEDATEAKIRGELEDLYCLTKSKILTLMSGSRSLSLQNESSMVLASASFSRLPKLKLPHFSGKYSEYPNFISSFSKLVHKDESLSSIEKFNHLLSCLSSAALRTMKAFEITEENYPKALERLKQRYDIKYLIFQEHIVDLFNLPKVTRNSSIQLRQLLDYTNAHLSALQSLGSFEDITNALIIYLVNSKLDPESQNKWEEARDVSKLPTWENCAEILDRRCQYLESRDSKPSLGESSTSSRPTDKQKFRNFHPNNTSLAAIQISCLFSRKNGHAIYKCPDFLGLTVLNRFSEVKKRALCINCLNRGHSLKKCPSQTCRVCSMPHNTLLHRYNTRGTFSSIEKHDITPEVKESESNQPLSLVGNTSLQSSSLSVIEVKSHIFLATAVVQIKDKFGHYHLARALLDSASQLNFISENLAQLLKLDRTRVDINISGIGNVPTKVRGSFQANIKSRINEFETNLSMHVLPHITGLQPERSFIIDDWKVPENIQLADPEFFRPRKVEILIGAETFFQLLCVGQIKLKDELPTLQKTLFGWIVSGKYTNSPREPHIRSCYISQEINEDETIENERLNTIVEKFWEVEEIESDSTKYNSEQLQCETIFLNTFRRLPEGRFMVKLPFKDNPEEQLKNSYEIARRRFSLLEKRLSKDSALKTQYTQFLRDYQSAGHMELISRQDVPPTHYFMPHQCVLRPGSTSTKLRVVFDASCRTFTNKSLNDLLMVGPNVQDDLFSIMLRFRCYKFALTADIAAMYRQVLVYPEDRNFQLILWRESPQEELHVYKLNTVTYGTAPAPFLATRCLVQLAEEYASTMPLASRIIKRDFYMDDLITGADTKEELYSIKDNVDTILKTAQFNLRKWYSNDSNFLSELPEAERETTVQINNLDIVKTLGVLWEPIADEFCFQYQANTSASSRITKRTILSDISRLFDPLGLINPVVVKAKIFLQELWLLKVNWDESIPLNIEHRWRSFKAELEHINEIHIPRLVLPAGRVSSIEIHGFADASTRAYGCCIYIRSIDTVENIYVNLLSAKSKVAPIRASKSLPCLELCAALLLSRLVDKVRKQFPRPYSQLYLWSDSEIVLDWLRSHPSTWKTYVANRVSEIQKLTGNGIWKHVTSKANPADIISRGISASELSGSMWFTGPRFLQQPKEHWPLQKERHSTNDNIPERRTMKSILVSSVSDSFLETVYESSDFMKNCRRFAFVLCFLNNIKARKYNRPFISGNLTASEIDQAFLHIVWAIQQYEFSSEIQTLEEEKEVNSKSCIKKLAPFLDNKMGLDLLRVGGRLKNANLPYNNKFPILLPRGNPFVKSYVKDLHLRNFHAGPLALVSIVQQRFWIVNAREYARKIVRNCIHCFKYRPRLAHQIMGDLPRGRVNISLPFTHTGIDFCGPIKTTYKIRGRTLYKSYIAIFICFATRAVHIEVVSDLSSEAFIAALKRFIGRRNLCRHIYCDNATNFVGARRQLAEFRDIFFRQQPQKDIHTWCSNHAIEFHHIPPRSPHFGGMWEAAVKSAKTLLYRTLKDSLLTFEELTTVMIQIEAVLNSRPITAMSTDPNDEQALTPAHFLNQSPLECFVEPDFSTHKFTYLRRWQRISFLQQHFWRRWTKEYLSQLQERSKWRSQYPNITTGVLVLIHQDDLPPYKWKLGRVVATVPGSDGHIRVVEVKTATGILRRSIHKVAPLPEDD